MSEKFEESIERFYQIERLAKTELLNLTDQEKVSNREIANNLDFCIKNLILFSRVSLKHCHKIQEKQREIEARLETCEENQRKTQRELRKSLAEISNTLLQQKPLSSSEVRSLVQEIAQQPKVVEEQALALTAKLDEKLVKVEQLLQHLINWTA